jgi:hypothetical protein
MNYKIVIILIIFVKILNIIVFPFKKKIQSLSNFEEYLMLNDLISEIRIGSPEQKIEIIIKGEEHPFLISKIHEIYNENFSSTYQKLLEGENESNYDSFKKYYLSTDTFILKNEKFKNIEIKNFTFIYAITTNYKHLLNPAIIGLYYQDYTNLYNYNLILLLKQYDIIKNYAFSIEYNEENKGKLYIGDYFHNFNNTYNKNNFNEIYSDFKGVGYVWGNRFNNVTYNNISLSDSKFEFYFNITFTGIIGTDSFENILKRNFFFDNKTCEKISILKNSYNAYICNKEFDYKKFKELKFYHKELNETFILDYNDLFKEENGKIYFLIIFRPYGTKTWLLGEPFLKKYPFTFNQDKKKIGFYKIIHNNNKFSFHYTWFIIISLIVVCFLLLFLLIKNIMNKPRKIRANELEDNYDYFTQIN